MKMEENLIFKAMVGSQSYGTAIATSDEDFKGVYMQHPNEILTFGYKEQIEVGKDECYYEVRRFLQLLQSANPTVLELLYSNNDCIIHKSPVFDLIVANRDKFLTKKCLQSFGGYAVAQIKKAKGLDKKMNWEHNRVERKTPLDMCYVYENGKTLSLTKWLEREGKRQECCGLIALDHFKDCYALYYDHTFHINTYGYVFKQEIPKEIKESIHLGFHGIIKEDSNDIRLSSVPKEIDAEIIMYYNKDGYTKHCNDYKSYQDWLKNRNTQRYVDIKGHNQQIDGKNLLHCRRLLDMAIEIATEKTIKVIRPNADYLLQIRKGEIDLQTIIDKAEEDIKGLDELFANSGLPSDVDAGFVNDLLLQIRHFK